MSLLCRVGLLGNAVLTEGGSFRPRLNTGQSPIAYKYREGKMQRTLKKESKGLEIAQRETIETSLHLPFHRSSCPPFFFLSLDEKKKKGVGWFIRWKLLAGQHVFVRWLNLSRIHLNRTVFLHGGTVRPGYYYVKRVPS